MVVFQGVRRGLLVVVAPVASWLSAIASSKCCEVWPLIDGGFFLVVSYFDMLFVVCLFCVFIGVVFLCVFVCLSFSFSCSFLMSVVFLLAVVFSLDSSTCCCSSVRTHDLFHHTDMIISSTSHRHLPFFSFFRLSSSFIRSLTATHHDD